MRALASYRFGGLKKRNGRGELRTVDPIAEIPRSFPTELHAENWLLRRLDPAVASVDVPEQPLHALLDGRTCKAKFSLLVAFKNGRHVADLVLKRAADRLWHVDAESVARAHGYELVFRDREELRANPVVSQNLITIRQRSVLWADYPGPLDATAIAERVRREAMTRRELYDCLIPDFPQLHIEQLDCAVFAGRLRGLVIFDLGEPYDDATRIESL